MNISESMEMYLETVYILENDHGHAHSVEIAKKLGVSKPSVTKAMNQLKANGYINKESYGSITLTEKGKNYSEKIYGTHELLTRYLVHSIGLNEDEAADNACKMEHIISDDMKEAIKLYLIKHKLEA